MRRPTDEKGTGKKRDRMQCLHAYTIMIRHSECTVATDAYTIMTIKERHNACFREATNPVRDDIAVAVASCRSQLPQAKSKRRQSRRPSTISQRQIKVNL